MLAEINNGLLINDLTFKYVFSHDYILKDLINAFLEYINSNLKVDYINIIPNEIYPINNKTKLFIGDIICTLNDSSIINVEMYSNNFTLSNYNKSLGYICRLFSNQLEASDKKYQNMKTVTGLVFMKGNFRRDNNELINAYGFHKLINHDPILDNKLEMYLVRLDKVANISYTLNRKRFILWLKILNAQTIQELNELEGNDKIMFDVKEYVRKFAIENARTWEDYIQEKTNEAEEIGYEYGMKQGVKQGVKKSKLKIAKAMLKNNIDLTTIINCTGLSKNTLLKLNEN